MKVKNLSIFFEELSEQELATVNGGSSQLLDYYTQGVNNGGNFDNSASSANSTTRLSYAQEYYFSPTFSGVSGVPRNE